MRLLGFDLRSLYWDNPTPSMSRPGIPKTAAPAPPTICPMPRPSRQFSGQASPGEDSEAQMSQPPNNRPPVSKVPPVIDKASGPFVPSEAENRSPVTRCILFPGSLNSSYGLVGSTLMVSLRRITLSAAQQNTEDRTEDGAAAPPLQWPAWLHHVCPPPYAA